ncbi:hypothetical protein [Brevundimonas sp.]|uniref:hypothetical protein n=1 Tax=Brevundimonas sp. TaxID=1871086 RepID=UPI002EDA07AE
MSDIKTARDELNEIADDLEVAGNDEAAREIRDVVNNRMYRRSPARRAPIKSQPITERMKQRIIDLAETTNLHSAEIAVQLDINPGRVSEVLQGDR